MYTICKKTYDDGADGSHLCPDYADLLADKYLCAVFAIAVECCLLFTSYVWLLLCSCFVTEDGYPMFICCDV